jgi:hypothetical protein
MSLRRSQCICAALGLLLTLAHAQTTSLRQNRIFEGDVAELTIEHDAKIPSLYAIDTSILDTDFKVLEVHPRVSRHFGENETFHRMQWKIELVPRRGGSIAIPPLAFGNNHSEPILLRVDPAPASIRVRENVFIEIEAFPENPYPGQQIRVTTRLFHNLPLHGGDLAEPETEQATIFRNGKDSRYSLLREGESFDVLERSILLTPDSSGQLPVTAANFRGTIRSGAELVERYIYRQGEDLRLTTREKPPGFDNRPWLPARQLELALQWDEPAANPQVGDSLGVTLSLEAKGLPAEALPADLLVTDSGQYKIYADEAVRDTRIVNQFDGEQLVGQLRQRYVIMPQQPGEFVMPALDLAWWDVELDVERVARVESRAIQVAISGAFQDDQGAVSSPGLRTDTSTSGLLPVFVYRHWPWLIALAVVLLLATMFIGAERLRARIGAQIALAGNRRRCRIRLRRACYANDARTTRRALIEWGRLHWGDAHINGLHPIEARVGSPQLVEELARLDAAVFAERADSWRGERLWELLGRERSTRSAEVRGERDMLPGPYPQRP